MSPGRTGSAGTTSPGPGNCASGSPRRLRPAPFPSAQICSSSGGSAPSTSRWGRSSGSIARMRGPEFASTCSSCGPRVAVLIGTRMAPSHAVANQVSTTSRRFSAMIATRSPAPTPAAARLPAVRATASRIPSNVRAVSPTRRYGRSPSASACRSSSAGSVRSAAGASVIAANLPSAPRARSRPIRPRRRAAG